MADRRFCAALRRDAPGPVRIAVAYVRTQGECAAFQLPYLAKPTPGGAAMSAEPSTYNASFVLRFPILSRSAYADQIYTDTVTLHPCKRMIYNT